MAEHIKPIHPEKRDKTVTADEHDSASDRRLLWKRDLVLIPITGTLYMLLFLDRTYIANACALGVGTPNGLEGALNMPLNGYNVALAMFYIPFVLAEIPVNLLLVWNRIRPGYLLGGQMAILASLPAGATYLISVYYTKKEAALRFAWFFNFALAGPLFSGLLAYAIQNIDGAGGYQGWRWVFIIEVLMTVFISIFIISFCLNLPHQAQPWFLTPHERDRVIEKLEQSRGDETKGSPADRIALWKVLLDWRIHVSTLCFFCCDITASSISAFAPTILTELGWTRTVAQLMSMPIWATGIVSTFTLTWLSTRLHNCRAIVLLFSICLQLCGWGIEHAYVPQAGVRYLALFLMSAGTFLQMAILMGWLSANLRGRKHLAVGMAWVTGFGNCANFVSANVFIRHEAPRYPTGLTTGLVFTIAGFLLVCTFTAWLMWKNKQREVKRAKLSDAEKERYDEVHHRFFSNLCTSRCTHGL
ncbi:MFS general substrate transporter [Bimuria novae-zelandiae CBS 107.79]|uniref:MFS general substrate transporter n=1 Tax=Bimuria novae-zelandiae CBS 107.79 TaxID=1447943 RepID=A0A6A5VBR8_9PLEO|nr:MFS general substrate transporter [Bimuria novae-zelandiae CBS 107.79]